MSRMMQRVSELGGVIDDSLKDTTTHAVCDPGCSEKFATEKLGAALPRAGLHLVTPDFISTSIVNGKLQSESNFLPRFVVGLQRNASRKSQRPKVLDVDDKSHGSKASVAAACPPSKRPKRNDDYTITHSMKTPQKLDSEDIGYSSPSADGQCVVERRGSDWVPVRGRLPRFTGGHTGIPWGSYGVWAEPYDEKEARNTVRTLRRFWLHTGEGGASDSGDSGSQQQPAALTNGVCKHIACARRPYCLVDRLGEMLKVYMEGRDQYKIKAIRKAQTELRLLQKPLNSDEDVDAVGFGAKSTQKIKEILKTGRLARVSAAAEDERMKAVSELLKIWGVGPQTAERWYALGCRNVDDVAQKAAAGEFKLSEQQRVGIKYYTDFQIKIPREEVAVAERLVREATFQLVENCGGSADAERTFVAATGSYGRGKLECGDIDILIVLPPSLAGFNVSNFLHTLLGTLLQSGLLVDELDPRGITRALEGATHVPHRASWMGVCRPPCSPAFRRIDFKIYEPHAAACAVNYFANSQDFCRATRFWADHAAVRAQQYCPSATGFRLSDTNLVPTVKESGRSDDGNGSKFVVAGSPLEVASETELYEALGLTYVPAALRSF